ncbi:Serine/threonine-protein phosphatase 7 long form-like [Vitis vinifera]|uniref:Serine/threonine-protein phosphatase 7 long form-like n=1 Tax=Vitis vinifera TaxID=29760 RepID=A0A438JB94_VITVI|nr:Serine/threonine-protein phosphatase 7 long form-like [Vitis vinifera]
MVSARFRRHPRGLRNYFATPSYLHKAAKLASTLRFPAPFSRHALCKMLLSARSDWLVMAATSSFQLRIAHRLKHWIVDFLNFEMVLWDPYMEDLVAHLPMISLADQEIWRTMSPLVYFDIVEWHRLKRVLRQFGL